MTEFDLQYAADRRVGTYSGGMRRRIDIACGLVVRPEVVFLDEPTTGLDPRSRQVIWDLVASFKKLGIATLLTTQYLEEADALSDRIIVIDHGEIVAEGTADELKERTGGSYCEIVPQDLNDVPAVGGGARPADAGEEQGSSPGIGIGPHRDAGTSRAEHPRRGLGVARRGRTSNCGTSRCAGLRSTMCSCL